MQFTHLTVEETPNPNAKTKLWLVRNKYEGDLLGRIRWWPTWRKYTFAPEPGCVFEEVCMRELSQFLVNETHAHKKR